MENDKMDTRGKRDAPAREVPRRGRASRPVGCGNAMSRVRRAPGASRRRATSCGRVPEWRARFRFAREFCHAVCCLTTSN